MPQGYVPQGNSTTSPSKDITVNKSLLQNLGVPEKRFCNISIEVMRQFVYVTGASMNHFNESKDLVASIQEHSPDKEILYFDLGLEEDQRHQVRV